MATSTTLNQSSNTRSIANIRMYAAINGASMFLLSYLVVYFTSQVATFLLSRGVYKLNAVLYYNKLEFPIEDRFWQVGNVVPVFSIGPLVAFGAAIVFFILFRQLEEKRSIWKQFCFWGMLHGINLSLGAIISGTFTHAGAWFALRWSVIHNPVIFAIAFLAFALMIGIGLWATLPFFKTCDSISLMQLGSRQSLLMGMLILPWVLGNLFLGFLKYPVSDYDHGLIYTMAFIIIPIYIRSQDIIMNDKVNTPRRTYIAWGMVGMSLFISFVIRMVLNSGINI